MPHNSFAGANPARESLMDRATKCNFRVLLPKMIQEDNRLTATQALEDTSLPGVLREAQVLLENIDKCMRQ